MTTSEMTRHRKLLALLAAALLTLTGAAAAQDASEEEEEPKWYTVEAIIFERVNPDGLETEQWTADPGEPGLGDAIELTEATDQPLDVELVGDLDELPHAFRSLPGVERQLDAIVGRLERSEGYRPLMHLAWRQPGFSEEQSKPVHVQTGARLLHPRPEDDEPSTPPFPVPSAFAEETAPESEHAAPADAPAALEGGGPLSAALEGTLRLHLARYLHLEADLLYFRPPAAEPSLGDEDVSMSSSESPAGELDGAEVWQPTLFRLRESRRMRSGELHYFDHPLFGVLALVTPFELPEPEEASEEMPEVEGQPEGSAATQE